MMKKWIKALWSETILSTYSIMSAISTLYSFFLSNWSGKWRLATVVSTLIGFAWANLNVFRKQEDRIDALEKEIASNQLNAARLKIRPDIGSRYILQKTGDLRQADFSGCFFDFHLLIQNTGKTNSVVDNFQIEIVELHQTFCN